MTRRLVGKGRSGQHSVGHNLCLGKKPWKEGDSVAQQRSRARSWTAPCEGRSPALWACLPPWIWSCRLLGQGTSPAVPWRATLLTYCLPQP